MANEQQLRQFFAEQKVPICLAITDSFMFFEELVDTSILSKAESLELQASTNSVPRAIYKCLCLIEEKGISVRRFFKILLQKHYLDTFPDLEPILKKYESKQYKISTTSSSSKKKLLSRSFKRNKVAIAFAIKRRFPFLQGLRDWGMLSKRQSLILQTDLRPVDRVVYESLCLVEEKGNWFDKFFDYVFQESFLKLYPPLKKISRQHKKEEPDREPNYKISKTFQYKKVAICMAVTKKFPFLHGLCDFGFLSESDLTSLLADDRQVERVIYRSLCWIEKRKTNYEDFSDFISQDCLRKIYPKLNGISVCSSQSDPGNTERYGICTEELTLILKREKTRISNAISKTFPFMEGLQDRGILSKMETLTLRAEGMTAMNTVHKTMCLIEQRKKDFIREFFDYLSQDMYLEMFPKLLSILRSLLKIVKEEKEASSCSAVKEESIDSPSSSGAVKDEGTDWSLSDDQEERTNSTSSDSYENSNNQPEPAISEAWTDSWEDVNDPPMPQIGDVWSECVEDVNEHSPMPMDSEVTADSTKEEHTDPPFLERSDLVTAEDVTDTDESSDDLPSQVRNEVFLVTCGNKKGIFLKSKWKGDTSRDICIRSEEQLFTVTDFERFGGKASSKNWKKTIKCDEVTLETLIWRGILAPAPSRRKRRYKPQWKKSSVVKGDKSRKLSSCHANDFLNSGEKQDQCKSQNESPEAHIK